MRRRLALSALAWLAACAAPQPDIRSTITPEAIAASTEPLLFVELPETGAQAIMSLTGRNGDVVTWSTADGRSISLQDGVLVATRGFGFDLMSAEVSGTIAALNGGPQQYERFSSYLDGENQTILRSFICEMSRPTTEATNSFGRLIPTAHWIEKCKSLDSDTRAEFWLSDDEIWRSSLPVGGTEGSILIERLSGG